MQTVWERNESDVEKSPGGDNLSVVPSFLKEFVLPAGYPGKGNEIVVKNILFYLCCGTFIYVSRLCLF